MGEHIDSRKYGKRNKKVTEGGDPAARARRVSFKHYLRDLEEELLDEELEEQEIDPDEPKDED